eukprot:551488-Pyramimonas_sp.AAC.1
MNWQMPVSSSPFADLLGGGCGAWEESACCGVTSSSKLAPSRRGWAAAVSALALLIRPPLETSVVAQVAAEVVEVVAPGCLRAGRLRRYVGCLVPGGA